MHLSSSRHERVPVGRLPLVVEPLSGESLALYFLANEKLPGFLSTSQKLERVISNLLENSSKFAPPGGTVWLHAEPYMWERRVERTASVGTDRRRRSDLQPNSVKVSVSDTGPGIPAEFHMEVFDDFFRLPASGKQGRHGLGPGHRAPLGQGMGGKIWVESDPARAANFLSSFR